MRKKRAVNPVGLQQARATTKIVRSLLLKAKEARAQAEKYEDLAAEIKNGLLRQR